MSRSSDRTRRIKTQTSNRNTKQSRARSVENEFLTEEQQTNSVCAKIGWMDDECLGSKNIDRAWYMHSLCMYVLLTFGPAVVRSPTAGLASAI